MIYQSQRSQIRQCIVDALLADATYARECAECRAVISEKCLGDSPSGGLDYERAQCCPVYIGVYTDRSDIKYDDDQSCGRGTLDVVIDIFICDDTDYEREEIADEVEEAVMIRFPRIALGAFGVQKVMGYTSRSTRDPDVTGSALMLRQLMVTLDVVADHSSPLCNPVPAMPPKYEYLAGGHKCAPVIPE